MSILKTHVAFLFFLYLTPSIVIAEPSPTHTSSIANPDINTAALVYSRSGGYSSSECRKIASSFDVIIGPDNADCREIIKETNPGIIMLSYTNSSNCTEGDDLCSFLEKQDDPEKYFLNLTSDSVQDIDGKVFKRPKGSRLCSYGSGNWCSNGGRGSRWTTDYVSEQSRKKIVEYFSDISHLGSHYDGYFFDNMDRACSYMGVIRSGTLEYSLEKGKEGDISSSPRLEEACNKLRVEMDKAFPKTMYFIDNVSNYGLHMCGGRWWWQHCSTAGGKLKHRYPVGMIVGRGVLQEYLYRFTSTFDSISYNYDGLKEIWRYRGKPKNNIFMAWWEETGGGDVPARSDRVKLFALSSHLLHQFPAIYMRFDGKDVNSEPLEGDWIPAMATKIGKAQGSLFAIDKEKRTFQRNFSNGVVIVRFRTDEKDNYTDTGTYKFKRPIIPVSANGEHGEPIDTITLHNSEGFIGIYH